MGKGRAHWHKMQTLSLRICTASVNIYWMTPAINQPNVALIVCQQVLIVCQQVQVPQMGFACGVGKTIPYVCVCLLIPYVITHLG